MATQPTVAPLLNHLELDPAPRGPAPLCPRLRSGWRDGRVGGIEEPPDRDLAALATISSPGMHVRCGRAPRSPRQPRTPTIPSLDQRGSAAGPRLVRSQPRWSYSSPPSIVAHGGPSGRPCRWPTARCRRLLLDTGRSLIVQLWSSVARRLASGIRPGRRMVVAGCRRLIKRGFANAEAGGRMAGRILGRWATVQGELVAFRGLESHL
jgi:hypothetical protein